MQYHCVHCDVTFDFEGEGRPRCPQCMRVHDLREQKAVAENGAHPARKWAVASMALLAACAGLLFWYLRSEKSLPQEPPLRPLSERELGLYLEREGVRARGLEGLFRASAEVERFARTAAAGKSSPEDKARAVVNALRERARKGAFVEWSRIDPRDTPPAVAERVLEMIEKDDAAKKLYPLEVAALAVAAVRSLGVQAMLAEAFAFEGASSPPDPSGRFGYLLMALPGRQEGQAEIFDPYGGRTLTAAGTQFELLTDTRAVGLAMNLKAIHLLAREQDPTGAIAESDAALRLTPRSPSVRGVRALVLLAGAGASQARSELESGLQIRGDAPGRNNLAGLLLVMGDVEGAARQVALALEQYRDFAAAHATLASVHLARRERSLARSELERSEKLDPQLPIINMLWAQFHASGGETEEAVRRAREGVRVRPDDAQSHLMLARIYREAARFPEMREQARQALELVPPSRSEEMKQLITGLLGPTALEQPDLEDEEKTEESPAAADLALPEPGQLRLGKGLRLLGDSQQSAPSGASLSKGGTKPLSGTKSGRPLLLLKEPKKLPSGGSDSKLELKP